MKLGRNEPRRGRVDEAEAEGTGGTACEQAEKSEDEPLRSHGVEPHYDEHRRRHPSQRGVEGCCSKSHLLQGVKEERQAEITSSEPPAATGPAPPDPLV